MKTGLHLSFAGMMGALLVLSSCAFAGSGFPNDAMPHFGKDTPCSAHLLNPTSDPPPQTIHLCKRNSGATSWSFIIQRIAVPPVTVCSRTKTQVPADGTADFPCAFAGNGSYRGLLHYCVNSTCTDAHWESKWTIP